MIAYFILKFLHVVGAAVLLGTGAGIAFFLWAADRTGRVDAVASVARIVVIADFLFTATAIAVQPVTGILLARRMGFSLQESWIVLSVVLYLVTGAFWVPVVFMQLRMRDLAMAAAHKKTALPAEYRRLFRRWFLFGLPAFGAVLAIFWLMIAKPVLF
jgi:uncharacterized membrane protein